MKAYLKNLMAGGVVAAALLAAPSAWAANALKIGVIMPVSGGGAEVGLALNAGINLAAQEINAAGGINGMQIELIKRDSQLKPDIASAAAKELITSEGVKMIIGPATSAESLAVSEVAKQEKVVNISPSAKVEAMTAAKLHKYIFQLPATTDIDGGRTAEVLKSIGAKDVCFAGYDYPYTQDLFKSVRASLGDIKEAGEFLVPLGTTDYSTMVTQLISNPCDTIVGTMWGGGFIAFAKQASPFGLFQQKKLVWGSNMGDYAVANALKGEFPEGMWAAASDVWYYDGSDAHKKFQEGLAKLQGRKETDMWPIHGYNAVYFLKAAIEKAGTTDADKVAEALEGITIQSPLGDLTIDAKTHRAASPEFYGQIVTVEGSDVKRMKEPRIVK